MTEDNVQTVADYLDRQYLLLRPVSDGAAYQLRHSVGLWNESLGRLATLADFQDEAVSVFIRWLEPRFAKRTVYGHRGNIIGIWNDAFDAGAVRIPPRRVRVVKKPKPNPKAWCDQDMVAIIEQCRKLEGSLKNGVARADYFAAIFSAAHDTGLRRSDLWELPRELIQRCGTIVLELHKTETPHVCGMRPETARMVLRLPGDYPLAWPHSPRHFYDFVKAICKAANVPHGALQMMRRSAATSVYSETGNPATVQQFLGHLTPTMWQHYVPRQRIQKVIQPRELPKTDAPEPPRAA